MGDLPLTSTAPLASPPFPTPHPAVTFSLKLRSRSVSFTRAVGISKYKIGLGGGKGWEILLFCVERVGRADDP
jgi:hypothetical protein